MEGDRIYFVLPPGTTDFYPRPPGGGRLSRCLFVFGNRKISIHALRVEGDLTKVTITLFPSLFLSTPSGWRATAPCTLISVSILYFYPRPPGGGRRVKSFQKALTFRFLSTPSGWRATFVIIESMETDNISIHALRVEGDFLFLIILYLMFVFLSTPSGWRATNRC